MEPQVYYSHGKILLCGEYAVLDGAVAFALPCKKGQTLLVKEKKGEPGHVSWTSKDENDQVWFSADISLPHLLVENTSDWNIAIQLIRFLLVAKSLNKNFLPEHRSYEVITSLKFGRDEGLGSSSTLTNNIAQWAYINPYALHFNAFKGSAYDIAIAENGKPLLYTMNGLEPKIEIVDWNVNFTDKLFFVHLNNKQNSREQVSKYKRRASAYQVAQISRISKLISVNDDYFEFCLLLELAENEMSTLLGVPTIKQERFPDFHGTVKSLGAWGGDYVLATGTDTENYFKTRGYDRIIPYDMMIRK